MLNTGQRNIITDQITRVAMSALPRRWSRTECKLRILHLNHKLSMIADDMVANIVTYFDC